MSASTLAQLRFLKNAAHLMRLSAPETSAFLMARRAGYAALHQEQQQQQQQQHHNGPVASRLNTTDTQRQYICSCCGHILIPGCNGTVLTIRPGRTTKQKKLTKKGSPKEAKPEDGARGTDQVCKAIPSRSSHEGVRKVFTCGLCGRDTVIALPPPVPLPRKRKRSETVDEHQALDSKALALPGSSNTAPKTALIADTPPIKSSNASSKKRAKSRKAGLLELLEKSRDGGSGSVRSQGLGLSFDDFRRR